MNRKWTPAPRIEVGDHVFLLAKFIKSTWPTKKLSEKYLGPFKVIEQPGTHSYLIKLPNHLHAVKPKIYSGLKLNKFHEFTPQEAELR